MASQLIQLSDSNGDSVYPVAPFQIAGSNSSAWRYVGFIRLPKTSTINYGTFLISGYDNISASWIFGGAVLQVKQAVVSGANVIVLTVTKVAPNGTPGVTFGYWDGGDGYWYIGAYVTPYRARLGVLPLAIHSNDARRAEVGEFYPESATKPTGWTPVGVSGEEKFAVGSGTAGAYFVFARFPLGSSSARAHTSLLVSGGGNHASAKLGTFILDCAGKATNVCYQTTLVSPGSATGMEFGSYIADGYVYIGMKRPAYSSEFTVKVLDETTNVTAIPSRTELAAFYNSTTAPSGWTTATT